MVTRREKVRAAGAIDFGNAPHPPSGEQRPPVEETPGLTSEERALVEWLAEEALRQWQQERR